MTKDDHKLPKVQPGATPEDLVRIEGGQPQEKVEDRPGVSRVEPEDYPLGDRAGV